MFFCKHDWTVLSEQATDSMVQHAIHLGLKPASKVNGFNLERKFIQVFACSKCGKLKRFVEEI